MTPTERQRIEKDADAHASSETYEYQAKESYIAGALAEHDKARNQAIDDVVNIIKRVEMTAWFITRYLIAEIKRLKTIS